MSLDLYIISEKPRTIVGTGVYIRENGRTRELKTPEEVRLYFPGKDVELRKYETDEVWHENMTHNLGKMARKVIGNKRNLYELLWRPQEDQVTQEWISEILECYKYILNNQELLKKMEEDNRIYEDDGSSYIWGSFDNLKNFVGSLVKCLIDLDISSEEYKLISDV